MVPANPSSRDGTIYGRQQCMEQAESVYEETKSLCQCTKSPAPTRANLDRLQSAYLESVPNQQQPPNVYQPHGAQLYNTQSTYPARNADLIRTESIYASRPPANQAEIVYGALPARQLTDADLDREIAYNHPASQSGGGLPWGSSVECAVWN